MEPGIHKRFRLQVLAYKQLVCNAILPGIFYECTQTIHSSMTSKVHDVDLLNFSTVSNAL